MIIGIRKAVQPLLIFSGVRDSIEANFRPGPTKPRSWGEQLISEHLPFRRSGRNLYPRAARQRDGIGNIVIPWQNDNTVPVSSEEVVR